MSLMLYLKVVLITLQVPNTVEFADWIGRTKQKQIRVTGSVLSGELDTRFSFLCFSCCSMEPAM